MKIKSNKTVKKEVGKAAILTPCFKESLQPFDKINIDFV